MSRPRSQREKNPEFRLREVEVQRSQGPRQVWHELVRDEAVLGLFPSRESAHEVIGALTELRKASGVGALVGL